MQLQRTLAIMLGIFFFIGCGPAEHVHEEEEHDHEEEASKEEVHLVKRQMDVMGIELGNFQYLDLSTTVRSNGQLELPPQNKASLGAVMEGRVKSINVLEGDKVTKGQVLAYLEHPEFIELQEQYITLKSQLEFLEQDYLRKKALHEDSITSTKAFQNAQADYRSAQGELQGLTAKLEMLGLNVESVAKGNISGSIPLRSPINGFVRSIDVNLGTYVLPNEEIFEIVDNEHIHIDLRVYEKDIAKIENGQKVVFSLASNPDLLFEGSIFAIGKSFEDEPKAMVVHAEIDNKTGGLLPGMYVDARIITNAQKVRALPDDAIVSDGGLNYIFVLRPEVTAHIHDSGEEHAHDEEEAHKHEEEKSHEGEFLFRKIEVSTGAVDIGFTEVVPAFDLPDDLQIVTKGAFYLLAEMKKGEGGHGHHH